MTSVTDVHVPQRGLTETLLHVAASPMAVLAAADRLDPARDPYAGVQVLGPRRFGLSWHPKPGAPGRVDVVFDLRIEQDAANGCYLASTHRFTATDPAAREALLRTGPPSARTRLRSRGRRCARSRSPPRPPRRRLSARSRSRWPPERRYCS